MNITSPAFKNKDRIPERYTCDGINVNPPLSIYDVPKDAKSLALILEDLDAPFGIFIHWIVYNIDSNTTKIKENSVPKGARLIINDLKKLSYGGPCPPSGIHRYVFNLYALNTKLVLQSDIKIDEFKKILKEHTVVKANYVGVYNRG